jgi:hypothetical protein
MRLATNAVVLACICMAYPGAACADREYAGRGGWGAANSVYRIICVDRGISGTGFLHKSGDIITADHVVHGCSKAFAIGRRGSAIAVKIDFEDADLDLAALKPEQPVRGLPLAVSAKQTHRLGVKVSTWGYPEGYGGDAPLLSVGYLAGIDKVRAPSGRLLTQWVVNAAFNHGNSGGPVIETGSAEVIGVVDSKVTPVSDLAGWAIRTLAADASGKSYTYVSPEGKATTYTASQLAALAVTALGEQVQLAIGHAVMLGNLKDFLKSHGVDP